MKKFKGLIFDFNGVLLLDQPLHDELWKQFALRIREQALTDDEIKKFFHGRTNASVIEYLLQRPATSDECKRWADEKEFAYRQTARNLGERYQLAPGVIELLNSLQELQIHRTIATSSPEVNVHFFNEMLHLDKWFDMKKIAFDDGTMRGKPAPDLYLRAAQLLLLKPEDCVVIEDASSGIAAAHAAGIGFIIAIGPKDSHESLRKVEGVNEVIEKLDDVDVQRLF